MQASTRHNRSPPSPHLPLSPPPLPESASLCRSFSLSAELHDPPPLSSTQNTHLYPAVLKQPFDDPYEVLCHEYNVEKTTVQLGPDGAVPRTVNMPVLQDAHMPTHALVVLGSADAPWPAPGEPAGTCAPALPINAEHFARRFTHDVLRASSEHGSDELCVPGSTLPVPEWDAAARAQFVTLPAIPLRAPHPPSVPLLLLFGLGLGLHRQHTPGARRSAGPHHPHPPRTPTGLLATYLLPPRVVEEFPAAAAMAHAMARACGDAELRRYAVQNLGLWRNVLALAPADAAVVDMVRTAWNVTAEARRMRRRGLTPPPPSPPRDSSSHSDADSSDTD